MTLNDNVRVPSRLAIVAVVLLTAACNAQPPAGLAANSGQAAADSSREGPIASPEKDWPQWNGRRRDGICNEIGLLPKWPKEGPKLLWKIDNLGRGWSSPIIVGQRLYLTGDVGDDLVVFAFNLDGKPVWQAKNGASWTGPYPGARACCAYSEGKLYHMNAHGRVACLAADTGKEFWAVNVLERFQGRNTTWARSECLLIDGRRVIVTPGGEKALMAALDKQTGQTVWTTEPIPGDRASHSSPLLFRHAGRRIIANCSSAHGFAVDADSGKLLWKVPLESPYGVNVAEPVYGDGQVFYTTPYIHGTCYRLRQEDGALRPERTWSTTLDTCTGSVLLVDGLLYGSGYKEHKSWLAIDWKSGETRYEYKGLTTGAAVYADGRLYCLVEDGRVGLLRPGKESFTSDGEFQLVTERVHDAWAHPVLLHGRLYLRYHDRLWCYDVRSTEKADDRP